MRLIGQCVAHRRGVSRVIGKPLAATVSETPDPTVSVKSQ